MTTPEANGGAPAAIQPWQDAWCTFKRQWLLVVSMAIGSQAANYALLWTIWSFAINGSGDWHTAYIDFLGLLEHSLRACAIYPLIAWIFILWNFGDRTVGDLGRSFFRSDWKSWFRVLLGVMKRPVALAVALPLFMIVTSKLIRDPNTHHKFMQPVATLVVYAIYLLGAWGALGLFLALGSKLNRDLTEVFRPQPRGVRYLAIVLVGVLVAWYLGGALIRGEAAFFKTVPWLYQPTLFGAIAILFGEVPIMLPVMLVAFYFLPLQQLVPDPQSNLSKTQVWQRVMALAVLAMVASWAGRPVLLKNPRLAALAFRNGQTDPHGSDRASYQEVLPEAPTRENFNEAFSDLLSPDTKVWIKGSMRIDAMGPEVIPLLDEQAAWILDRMDQYGNAPLNSPTDPLDVVRPLDVMNRIDAIKKTIRRKQQEGAYK